MPAPPAVRVVPGLVTGVTEGVMVVSNKPSSC